MQLRAEKGRGSCSTNNLMDIYVEFVTEPSPEQKFRSIMKDRANGGKRQNNMS